MSGQNSNLEYFNTTDEMVWKRNIKTDRTEDDRRVRGDASGSVGGNSIHTSKKDYILRKVNNLIRIIENTQLLTLKPEFRTQLYEFRNINAVIGLTVAYENSFLQNPALSVENLLNSYGFVKSDLAKEEFEVIVAYFTLIFTFVRNEILQKIK